MGPDSKRIQKLLGNRNLEEAGRLLDRKAETSPDDSETHYLRGVWHYFKGDIRPTVESLERALTLNPKNTDAAICLSVLFNDLGRYDDARRVFETANRSIAERQPGAAGTSGFDDSVDRKFAVKHLELADLYFRYRRFGEAVDEYSKAIALDPSNLDIRIKLAKAFARRGFFSRALQELQQLKREHPRFGPARVQLGLLHFQQGNVLDAEVEWEDLLTFEPENREAKACLEMSTQASHDVKLRSSLDTGRF